MGLRKFNVLLVVKICKVRIHIKGYNQAFMIIIRNLQNSVNKLADQEISILVGVLVYIFVYYKYGNKKGNHYTVEPKVMQPILKE